jgi:hypothetical protein
VSKAARCSFAESGGEDDEAAAEALTAAGFRPEGGEGFGLQGGGLDGWFGFAVARFRGRRRREGGTRRMAVGLDPGIGEGDGAGGRRRALRSGCAPRRKPLSPG